MIAIVLQERLEPQFRIFLCIARIFFFGAGIDNPIEDQRERLTPVYR